MTNEEKQLLLQVFCEMLPHGVIINSEEYNEANYRKHYLQKLISIKLLANKLACIDMDDYPDPKIHDWRIELCKPYLRPMSSMTEEEKNELKEYLDAEEVDCNGFGYSEGGTLEDYISSIPYSICVGVVDWLNEHYLDYRGLIPMSLAIEAPKNMYK